MATSQPLPLLSTPDSAPTPAPRAATPRPEPDATAARQGAVYPRSRLWNALREVRDPELPVSIVDLGLIVALRHSGGRVEVDITFTATACPCMDFIKSDVRERLMREPYVDEVHIEEVWHPAWRRARITAEGRSLLRQYGVAA